MSNQFIKHKTKTNELISTIHVGCGPFSLQRLQILVDSKKFLPIACVDLDVEKAKKNISAITSNYFKELSKCVYRTITEAKEKHN